jgi:hypothetical protein
MIAAGGIAAVGDAIRNWDNARGHHERRSAIRLDEAVLAHSGGHWLSPPAEVRWTDAHARARDELLAARVDGRPVLIKDPRALLVLPFWRASRVPFHAVGVVRHPLAVARSLESWREVPLSLGIALWTAHVRALAADRAAHGTPVVDFEQPGTAVIEAVRAACEPFAPAIDRAALAAAYDARLVHHDGGDPPSIAGLDDAVALYQQLAGAAPPAGRAAFPRAELAAFGRLLAEGDVAAAIDRARAALGSVAGAAAVLVPVVTALVRNRVLDGAHALIAEQATRLDDGLADLLHGKVALASGDAARAVRHLEAACAIAPPYFQSLHLRAQALRAAGRADDARVAMSAVVRDALYPHRPLATLAEWRWLDGDPAAALAEMQRAIEAAPPHRRGRLRTRRAEWLAARGDREAARHELALARAEDPAYERSHEVLDALDV